jgi:hypothetical protein
MGNSLSRHQPQFWFTRIQTFRRQVEQLINNGVNFDFVTFDLDGEIFEFGSGGGKRVRLTVHSTQLERFGLTSA